MQDKLVYTVDEVAALLGLSRQTITRMFEQERGVIILARTESIHKRRYRSIRIPHPVLCTRRQSANGQVIRFRNGPEW